MLTGSWTSFEEVEESLTLAELNKVVEGIRDQEDRYIRSFAAIMGVEMGEAEKKNEQETAKDRIQRRLREKRGESPAEAQFKDAKRRAKEQGFSLGLGYKEVSENNN